MAESSRVLLVDDDPASARTLATPLGREGYFLQSADGGRSALRMLSSFRPHILITDSRVNDTDGLDGMALFEAISARRLLLPVVMLTASGSIPEAVEATRRGMFAYLTKPFETETLLATLDRARHVFGTRTEGPADGAYWRQDIISRSTTMESLLREAWLFARSDSSVLIRGGSGTGKELFARAIHKASDRHSKPMIAVNCSAIPEQLFEAELFGHKRGAFTGATQSRVGLIEAANGGSIFFDEVGDMPLACQTKLLRMLQEREFRPVGSSEPVRVDVRVISATHQNLEQGIDNKTFREDLYYRLNVVTLEIPALERRREDIPALVGHFLQRGAVHREGIGSSRKFSKEAMEMLIAARWPGNVRQLRNVVEQCLALSTNFLIPASLVERALKTREKGLLPFAVARDRFESNYLSDVLAMTEGNVAQAARLAGRNRTEIYKLLNKHDLEPSNYRQIQKPGSAPGTH
jgi:two-component system response regulator GlrR